jgi:hypothetical protein
VTGREVVGIVLLGLLVGYIKLVEFGWRKRAEQIQAERAAEAALVQRGRVEYLVRSGLADDEDDALDQLADGLA